MFVVANSGYKKIALLKEKETNFGRACQRAQSINSYAKARNVNIKE